MNTPDKAVLNFLAKKGIGYYADITPIIREHFVMEKDESFSEYRTRTLRFLDDLERHQFVKYNNTVFTEDKIGVQAAIQEAGIRYVTPVKDSSFDKTNTVITGSKGVVVNVGSAHSKTVFPAQATKTGNASAFIDFLNKWKLLIGALAATIALFFTVRKNIAEFSNATKKSDTSVTQAPSVPISNDSLNRKTESSSDTGKVKKPASTGQKSAALRKKTQQKGDEEYEKKSNFRGDTTVVAATDSINYKVYTYRSKAWQQILIKPFGQAWDKRYIFAVSYDEFKDDEDVQINFQFGYLIVKEYDYFTLSFNGKPYQVRACIFSTGVPPGNGVVMQFLHMPSVIFFGPEKNKEKVGLFYFQP